VECEDPPFGAWHADLSRGGLDAAPFATARALCGPSSEREEVAGRELVVLVPVVALQTEPDSAVGSVAEVGDARDGIRRAEVAVPHQRRV